MKGQGRGYWGSGRAITGGLGGPRGHVPMCAVREVVEEAKGRSQ